MDDQIIVRPIESADRKWIAEFMKAEWGSNVVVTRGVKYRPDYLYGYVAVSGNGAYLGLVTYKIRGDECEIISMNALQKGNMIGTDLLGAASVAAKLAGCKRLWLITTNDNLDAMRFYQRRGMRMVAVHPGAIEKSRQLKPEIPAVGMYQIPIRDEVEFEMDL